MLQGWNSLVASYNKQHTGCTLLINPEYWEINSLWKGVMLSASLRAFPALPLSAQPPEWGWQWLGGSGDASSCFNINITLSLVRRWQQALLGNAVHSFQYLIRLAYLQCALINHTAVQIGSVGLYETNTLSAWGSSPTNTYMEQQKSRFSTESSFMVSVCFSNVMVEHLGTITECFLNL